MQELSVSKAAERSEMSAYHIRHLLKEGIIAGRKVETPVGSYWMVDVDSLDRYTNDWRARKPGARRKQREAKDTETQPEPDMPLLALGAMP